MLGKEEKNSIFHVGNFGFLKMKSMAMWLGMIQFSIRSRALKKRHSKFQGKVENRKYNHLHVAQ